MRRVASPTAGAARENNLMANQYNPNIPTYVQTKTAGTTKNANGNSGYFSGKRGTQVNGMYIKQE